MTRLSEANRLRVLYFLVLSCTASWLPIFADNLKGRGFTGLEIGLILSVTPLTMFVIQPFYGVMADRWGYKKCLIISSIMAAIGFLLYLLEGTFASVLAVTIFMSIFYNGLQPVLDSLTLRLTTADARFNYGTVRIAGAIGWAFTGIIVGHYIEIIDTRIIFVFSAVASILVVPIALTLPNELPQTRLEKRISFGDLRRTLNNKAIPLFLLFVFLVSASVTTIWNFYSIYMKENGASASLVGLGISFQGLCEIPFFYFSSHIITRFNLKNTLIIAVFASALRMLLYSVVTNPIAALPIELLHGLSWSLFWVVCVEYTNRLIKPEWRATGQSILYASYFGLGAIVGNFWTGLLYDQSFTIASIFFLNAGVVILVGLGVILIVKQPAAEASSLPGAFQE